MGWDKGDKGYCKFGIFLLEKSMQNSPKKPKNSKKTPKKPPTKLADVYRNWMHLPLTFTHEQLENIPAGNVLRKG